MNKTPKICLVVESFYWAQKKTWNQTREKYMPGEKRQNSAELLEESLDEKGEFYNGIL